MRLDTKHEKPIRSPLQILLVIITAVFLIELLVMRLIRGLNLPEPALMLIDSGALILILVPTLFLFVYRPLANSASNYKQLKEEIEVSHNMLITVLDSLDAIVYVADIKTHELLFLNKFAHNIFGDVTGEPCWAALQSGQTGPCSFCSNPQIINENGEPTGVYEWEFCNTINGCWYDIRDRAIHWVDGRLVRLEIATDITARKKSSEEREKLISELETALSKVKLLSGIVPICMYCKEIRDDQGYWNQLEAFISEHSEAEFSHGICPKCAKAHFPDQASRLEREET